MSQEEDRSGDGEVDAKYSFGPGGSLLVELLDEDHDGRLETVIEYDGDQIARRTIEGKRSGEATRTEYFDAGELSRVEIDESGNGRTDLWNFYADGDALARHPCSLSRIPCSIA